MRWLSFFVLSAVIFTLPSRLLAEEDVLFNPDFLLSDADLFDADSMTLTDVSRFLTRGGLSAYSDTDIDGARRTAAQIVWNASQEFSLSPKFLLTLLQREQSLVEDPTPSEDQLAWAMGYAVCDDCSKSDPRIQKFKGFAAQVHYAAERIRESYLADLERRGYTETGVGPGIEITIDNTTVTPVNFATASLYTYTPHLHGNKNFVTIWEHWFGQEYLTGSLLQDKDTGGIWLIQYGARRPITSRAAFFSRFNASALVAVSGTTLESYPVGAPISFPNYSLLRSPGGTVYLLVDDTRRGFTSQEAFRSIGFSPDEITDVSWDDLNVYIEGEPITTETLYPQGALLQNNVTGGVFYVENGEKHPIVSREILASRFSSQTIVPVEPENLDSYPRGDEIGFADGTLIGVAGSPDIFVVSEGDRRPIVDEVTFFTYGWSFDQVVWTNERSVLLHPLGAALSTDLDEGILIASN
ncbi:hypothetical protein HY631_03840 [Candidatus Uhrbacteria bacterium]|nr:hypothetical protein [Candidatus Uhrbacteria bacterium]